MKDINGGLKQTFLKGRLQYSGILNLNTHTIMERILTELTLECEKTAVLYLKGSEKKEIAEMKCRAISTINNQTQTAMSVLNVRNGRELASLYYERILKSAIACCLLLILILDSHFEMRRQRIRTRSNANVELVARSRTRVRGRDIPLAA